MEHVVPRSEIRADAHRFDVIVRSLFPAVVLCELRKLVVGLLLIVQTAFVVAGKPYRDFELFRLLPGLEP
ncbi:hypothetical protein D3C86_2023300 [compost metagenome]